MKAASGKSPGLLQTISWQRKSVFGVQTCFFFLHWAVPLSFPDMQMNIQLIFLVINEKLCLYPIPVFCCQCLKTSSYAVDIVENGHHKRGVDSLKTQFLSEYELWSQEFKTPSHLKEEIVSLLSIRSLRLDILIVQCSQSIGNGKRIGNFEIVKSKLNFN